MVRQTHINFTGQMVTIAFGIDINNHPSVRHFIEKASFMLKECVF